MSENTNPIESQIESGEVRGTEQEALNDATFEPQSYVEQTGDYRQSEAVQQDFETVVDSTATAGEIPSTAKDNISDGESEKTAKDPLTGKGGEDQGSSSDNESSNDVVMDQTKASDTQTGAVSEDKPVSREAEGVPPSEIDGNDPVYEMDTDAPGSDKDFSEETNEPIGNTGEVDPQRLGDENLPQELLTPQEGPGMKGPRSGGKKPGSVPKSGGGPPVGGRGAGSKSSGGGYHEHGSTMGNYLFMQMVFSGKHGYVMEKDGKGVWAFEEDGFHYYEDFEIVNQTGQTFDGDTGMPYTGSFGGGEDPDPKEPMGGPNTESGRFSPVVGLGGGSDKSGGTPGDKDGDDDSGKFLMDGTLSGDGGGFVDPGDLDYYTPTDIAEANEKTKKSTEGRG